MQPSDVGNCQVNAMVPTGLLKFDHDPMMQRGPFDRLQNSVPTDK